MLVIRVVNDIFVTIKNPKKYVTLDGDIKMLNGL